MATQPIRQKLTGSDSAILPDPLADLPLEAAAGQPGLASAPGLDRAPGLGGTAVPPGLALDVSGIANAVARANAVSLDLEEFEARGGEPANRPGATPNDPSVGPPPGRGGPPPQIDPDAWDNDAAVTTKAPAGAPGHAPVGKQAPADRPGHGPTDNSPALSELPDVTILDTAASMRTVADPSLALSAMETTTLQAAGGIFYASSYGAKAGDATDDTAAINNAIKAAAAAGGGTVLLGTGTYILSGNPADKSDGAIRLLSNTTLEGAGMGVTILKISDSWDGYITGVVRTPFDEVTRNVGLFDLTIDGNRANTTGKIDGFYTGVRPGSTRQDADITVAGVEIQNMSGYGFDPHEQTIRLTIENSVAHHNGLDGFVADYIVDGVYRNNLAYANDRHGFNITTTTTNLRMEDNVARDNGSTGIAVQRGSENIPWPRGITIKDGEYYGNVREGILLKLADDVTIDGANIHHNGRSGIAVDGSTDTVISNNTINDNSQSKHLGYDEIRVDEFVDPTTGKTFPGLNTQVTGNIFGYTDEALRSAFAIREMNDSSSGTAQSGNTFNGWASGAVSIPGSAPPPTGPAPITGTDNGEKLTGTAEVDDIRGMGGDDTLVGGAGGDKLDGGDGFDVVSYIGDTVAVTVNLQAGTGSGSTAAGDTYISIEGAWGTSAGDTLTGDVNANELRGLNEADTLSGGDGNDTLDGGGGADRMVGGQGDDLYLVNMSTDVVVEESGEGLDTVGATNSHTLAANVENLIMLGTAANGTGNALDNLILGNDAANILKGMDGNDTLNGGGGADALTGGTGDDVFVLAKGALSGDSIADFTGAGITGGDSIRFEGFGAGATLSYAGGLWTVTDGAYTESFTMTRVTAMTAGQDYAFA